MIATVEDTTYNGWRNYPTWCVNLWLANDESLYHHTIDRVAGVLQESHPFSEYWTVEQSRRYRTAETLKDWVSDELCPDLGASFPADLLGYALGQVDWDEIADSWLETVAEQLDDPS